MSVRFAREPLTDSLWDEAMPLLRQHWAEVAHFPDIPLDPDRDGYAKTEAAGLIRCFTARDVRFMKVAWQGERPAVEGAPPLLVGYALYFVRPNPHYKSSVQAVQDVLYLDPSVRGGTGYRFIAWCDEQLAGEGVQATYQHVKAAHDFGKLLQRQGYELVDTIWAKRLDAQKLDATWTKYGVPVRVLSIDDGVATILPEGYECSNTCPVDELHFYRLRPGARPSLDPNAQPVALVATESLPAADRETPLEIMRRVAKRGPDPELVRRFLDA